LTPAGSKSPQWTSSSIIVAVAAFASLAILIEGLDRVSAAKAVGLAVSIVVLIYLAYAVLRGEKL